MRNLKKFLALVLAMMMVLGLMVTANAAAFPDVDDDNEYLEAINVLSAVNVFTGYPDGTFDPDRVISRQEFAAVLYRIHSGDPEGKDPNLSLYAAAYPYSNDEKTNPNFAAYIGYAVRNNLIAGYPDGTFRGNNGVTVGQALVMLLRALGYDKEGEFTGSGWLTEAIFTAIDVGLLQNIPVADALNNAEASRAVLAQLALDAIQAPMVTYNKEAADGDKYTENKEKTFLSEKFGEKLKAPTDDVQFNDDGTPKSGVWQYFDEEEGKFQTVEGTGVDFEASENKYTDSVKLGTILTDLGLEKATVTVVTDGTAADPKEYKSNASASVGGNGAAISVYQTGEDTVVVTVWNTYVAVLGAASTDKGEITLNGVKYTSTNTYKKGDVVLYCKGAKDVVEGSDRKAAVKSGWLTNADSNGITIRGVSGAVKYLATVEKDAKDAVIADLIGDDVYYYVDADNGYVARVVSKDAADDGEDEVTIADVDKDYLWLITAGGKVEGGSDIFGGDATVTAQARVVFLDKDGNGVETIDLAVAYNDNASEWKLADLDGKAGGTKVVDAKTALTAGLYECVEIDGGYALKSVDPAVAATWAANKSSVTISPNTYYFDNNSVITFVELQTDDDGNVTGVKVTEKKGYKNFPDDATGIATAGGDVYTFTGTPDDEGVMPKIMVIKTVPTSLTSTVLGVYVKTIEGDEYDEYVFYVNGTMERYKLAADDATVDFDGIAVGDVWTLVLNEKGEIVDENDDESVDTDEADADYADKVVTHAVASAGGYIVLDGETDAIDLAGNCTVYTVTDGVVKVGKLSDIKADVTVTVYLVADPEDDDFGNAVVIIIGETAGDNDEDECECEGCDDGGCDECECDECECDGCDPDDDKKDDDDDKKDEEPIVNDIDLKGGATADGSAAKPWEITLYWDSRHEATDPAPTAPTAAEALAKVLKALEDATNHKFTKDEIITPESDGGTADTYVFNITKTVENLIPVVEASYKFVADSTGIVEGKDIVTAIVGDKTYEVLFAQSAAASSATAKKVAERLGLTATEMGTVADVNGTKEAIDDEITKAGNGEEIEFGYYKVTFKTEKVGGVAANYYQLVSVNGEALAGETDQEFYGKLGDELEVIVNASGTYNYKWSIGTKEVEVPKRTADSQPLVLDTIEVGTEDKEVTIKCGQYTPAPAEDE